MKNYDHLLWRNSGLSAKLGLGIVSVDARAILPIFILIFHLAWSSFFIVLGSIAFFAVLDNMGYKFDVAIKKARSLIAGKDRFVNRAVARRKRLING